MKKKIKDMTIEEFISIARKANESQGVRFHSCGKCPLMKVEGLHCWRYCINSKEMRENTDNIINQEIEVDCDEEKD